MYNVVFSVMGSLKQKQPITNHIYSGRNGGERNDGERDEEECERKMD